MIETAKKHGEIHHPQSGKCTHGAHFIAFGRVDKDVRLCGTLTGQDSGAVTSGRLVYLKPSKQDPSRLFWALRFKVQAAKDEKYTLRIADEADGSELACSVGVDLSRPRTLHPIPQDAIVQIGFPHSSDDPIPLEFMASGTAAAAGGAVSGTMSNCDPATDIEQVDPPPNWTLQCNIVNPNPPCTLTVTQSVNGDTSSGLTF